MPELELDLLKIETLSNERKQDFFNLKEAIKKVSVNKLDEIVHPIVDSITKKIDCTQCGNCCRYQEPGVNDDEIKRLARCKNTSVEEFKNEYIAWDKEGISFMFNKPCTFLQGNACSIYQNRPDSCADFPGLHRPALKWRFKQVEENYSLCPIVFNVVEELKLVLL